MINTDWQLFLESRGFLATTEGALQRSETAVSKRRLLLDLSHLGALEVGGEEAFDFLQGQFSNDLRAVSPSASQLSAYCNPKGRVLALFRILQTAGGGYRLIAPREILNSVLQRLRMFVLRAKVDIEFASDIITVGFAGEDMQTLIAETFGSAPQAGQTVATEERLHNTRVGTDRWLISGPVAAMQRLWERFETVASPANANVWRRLDILDGLPQVFAATAESFIPQTINLDLVDGVSFTKGCYPGQEIVARLRYLGKLKQRMICARVPKESNVIAGDGVFTVERGDQRVGTVIDAQPYADGMVLLTTAPTGDLDSRSLRLSPAGGQLLERVPLPYAIPEDGVETG